MSVSLATGGFIVPPGSGGTITVIKYVQQDVVLDVSPVGVDLKTDTKAVILKTSPKTITLDTSSNDLSMKIEPKTIDLEI